MRKIAFLLSVSLFICQQIIGQVLPNYMTNDEKLKLPLNYLQSSSKGVVTPPSSPVRNPAEWEEMQAILISWQGYQDFLTEIVRYAVDECDVYIYCSSQSTVNNYLVSNGVDVSRVHYIVQDMNSVWIRDYGPNNIYFDQVGDLAMVDWIYNRPRPEDDASPQAIADLLGVTLYETTQAPTDLVNTGGNFMSDGFGTAFAEKLILDENNADNPYGVTPKSEVEIDAIFQDFMGIDRYIKIDELPNDGIHHIDMHMKLLDEETLLIGWYPDGISDGPQIEANIQYIQDNFVSVFGTPYKIVRIPMPSNVNGTLWPPDSYYRTYTNSLIINKIVMVPTYYEKYDTTALRIYREAMPGYKIVGIDANTIIPASGTIHCTSHEVGAVDPLLISHQRLSDTDDDVNPYFVEAKIMHRTGINSAQIFYRTDTLLPYQSVNMTLSDAVNNIWSGFIPAQPAGSKVYYYIQATAVSGKSQVRPMPAPAGYWMFRVLNATGTPPLMSDAKVKVINSQNTADGIEVEVITSGEGTVHLALYDVTGKCVFNSDEKYSRGKTIIQVPELSLSKGMYILNITNSSINFSAKIRVL